MKISIYSVFLMSVALLFAGCEKDNYPGGTVSPYMSVLDLRAIHKGEEVKLNEENMLGSSKIAGVVISDHSGGNIPDGLLIVQGRRRLGLVRGIAIHIGDDARNYVPGDSVVIDVQGGVLQRNNGNLVLSGLTNANIQKISSKNTVWVNQLTNSQILANPTAYESSMVAIVKGGFNPLPAPTDKLSGDKVVNDGFGDVILYTKPGSTFANNPLPVLANYYGIMFIRPGENGALVPEHRLRTGKDVQILSSVIELAPVVISGYMADLEGGDGNYEYIQLEATRDIDFSETPFSVVVTNNANASTPTGAPVNGWATGGMRTFKFNITSGSAKKGTFFYVGGTGKRINGDKSTDISAANWVRAFNYTTTNGDGFGTKTGGLMANTGNASGVAVFEGTTVTADSKPVDVIFISTGGTLYAAGPPAVGYRIANTDFYDVKNPLTLTNQPFYRNGSNTLAFIYNSGQGYFNMLGGEYNTSLGRWTKARSQNALLLTPTSVLTEIEGTGATVVK